MAPHESFHYHAADDPQAASGATARSARSFAADAPDDAPAPRFTSDEAAARFYLDALLRRDDRPAMRAVVAAERPERVPELVVAQVRDLPALGTRQVRFAQAHRHIPVFGASAVVELTGERDLVSASAELAEVPDVDPVETLSRADALDRVARATGAALPRDAAVGGHLTFYRDEGAGGWHLAWLLPHVPADPPARAEPAAGTPTGETPTGETPASGTPAGGAPDDQTPPAADLGHGLGPRPVPPDYTFLVDAHDGRILFAYSTAPTAAPTRCAGVDEDEASQTFFGRLVSADGTAVVLEDPLRAMRTYDLRFADIDDDPPVPDEPVRADTSDYGTTNRAAVSAHVNAARVRDFYQSVLQRDGIDDNGMALISLVNVTAARMQPPPPPQLLNAFWWRQRMWYGQIMRDGRLVSLSRCLDVIGHELTHGVIASTSALVYATQSGALNESFADVAGVIIANWYTAPDRADVRTWRWEIGAGLRADGRPLRDFADPARLGYPAHMRDFRPLAPGELPHRDNDNGWVHYNSSIHNKAVHHLLTMTSDGAPIFSVEDVALLTYLGMARLTPLATFSAALAAVVDVARTYFGGDAGRDAKVAAIREAYGRVGIS